MKLPRLNREVLQREVQNNISSNHERYMRLHLHIKRPVVGYFDARPCGACTKRVGIQSNEQKPKGSCKVRVITGLTTQPAGQIQNCHASPWLGVKIYKNSEWCQTSWVFNIVMGRSATFWHMLRGSQIYKECPCKLWVRKLLSLISLWEKVGYSLVASVSCILGTSENLLPTCASASESSEEKPRELEAGSERRATFHRSAGLHSIQFHACQFGKFRYDGDKK